MTQTNSNDTAAPGLYRAFWRWHFYAGLIILPVLMLMALTGGLYLFKDEIEGAVYRPLMIAADAPAALPPQAWIDAASGASPGRAVQVVMPEIGKSARVIIEAEGGARRTVFVDPANAHVLGSISTNGFMQTIKRLHSLDIAGPIANLLVEVVAGWAIIMVFTGIVLWWPRGQKGGVVTVRGTPKKRVFWRDFHAVVGIFAGLIIVFLSATGMPWSAVWGQQVRRITTEAGLGRPEAPAAAGAFEHAAHHAEPAVPWALQESDLHTAHSHGGMTIDTAAAQADAVSLPRPYTLNIPSDPGLAWSAAYMPAKVEDTRTVYIDPAGGGVLADIGYSQFGPAAQTIEWGIAVHQGKQFGLINKLIMLAGCIAVWLLGISAFIMWWKRRPKGRLAAPPAPEDKRGYLALALVVAPLAILYPLVGASIVIVLILDLAVRRMVGVFSPAQRSPS